MHKNPISSFSRLFSVGVRKHTKFSSAFLGKAECREERGAVAPLNWRNDAMIPKTSLRTRPSSAGFPGKAATSTGLGMRQSDCRYPVCFGLLFGRRNGALGFRTPRKVLRSNTDPDGRGLCRDAKLKISEFSFRVGGQDSAA